VLSGILTPILALSLVACGGGGGGDGTPQQGSLTIASTPTLDGPVGSSLSLGTDPSQRPDVGDVAGGEFVHGLFSFDLGQIPAGAQIVSASMQLTSTSTTGNPASMMGGTMVIDHLSYGDSFPSELNDITVIHQSGVALWDDVTTVGPRAFNVTSQVQNDQTAGRTRSQFRMRGLVSTNADSSIDLVTFSGGEDLNGNEPILTIAFQTN
jgi:hypothetical protein